jgi:hypothetical protein
MKRTVQAMLCGALIGTTMACGQITGQSPEPRSTEDTVKYSAPRTPWGHPDFQGIWTTDHFGQHVDLERPPELAGKFETTEEETLRRKDDEANRNAFGDTVGNYGREWRDTEFSRFKPSRRTSLISDPEDGRVPYLPEVQKQMAAGRQAARRAQGGPGGPEDLPDGLRCLRGFPGVNLPIGYNNNKQIVQSPSHITILYEMNHDMRVIPLTDRDTFTPRLRQAWGVPRGRWEGDTLVIETTNFTGELSFQRSRENLKVVERLTRTAADELDYRFTVEDPTVFARPWTVWMPWLRDDSQYEIYEYACHEGNYSLPNTLSAARDEERRAASQRSDR